MNKTVTSAVAALSLCGMVAASHVGAQSADVQAIEQERSVEISSASVVAGGPGQAAWFASAARSVIGAGQKIAQAASCLNFGWAATQSSLKLQKQETLARFGQGDDAVWTAAAQSATDALLAPPAR